MRTPVLALLVVALGAALCGCPGTFEDRALSANEDGDGAGGGSGSGSSGGGAGLAPNCSIDDDCVPAGPKCCDCWTHAVPANDPSVLACANVGCGAPDPAVCGPEMQAACEQGHCVLECKPLECAGAPACPSGFATDINGCLTCECTGSADVGPECTSDTQCARVNDDCCGCEMGGSDTSVPTSQVGAHEAMLACPPDPICPGVDTCAPDLAPRCVQGYCELVSGPLPVGACGRQDLPACPAGESCYVNSNDQATMHGVGVCQPDGP